MTPTPSYAERLAAIDEIRVSVKSINDNSARGIITIVSDGTLKSFELMYSYREKVELNENLAGLMMAFPAINFTLFARKLVLDFPASDTDLEYIRRFISINNTEVFVNKIVRRRYPFFKPEFIPEVNEITEKNSTGLTTVTKTSDFADKNAWIPGSHDEVAVLSSGGKESLLSYGMLHELGNNPHAFYFNESGSHWFTASTAFREYSTKFSNVHKVWSNVDRLYRFFLRNLPQIDQEMIKKKTDTYPVQLFIFPVYIMSMIPIARLNGISSIVLGDEFDDPREISDYMGIKHYYGVYDQTLDFNRVMSEYLTIKIGNFRIWSAVYPISGSVVEKILVSRYRDLYKMQRSCHSCRPKGGEMVPCGKCSKCLGVMMFVLAANGSPDEINYDRAYIKQLKSMVEKEMMRLDTDELNLMKIRLGFKSGDTSNLLHVDSVHLLPGEKEPFQEVPIKFRNGLINIIEQYAPVTFELFGDHWECINPDQKNSDSVLPISS